MDIQQAAKYWKHKLDNGQPIYRVRIRRLLQLAGAERRGFSIMERIRKTLEDSGLSTEPDFRTGWIDGFVTVKLIGSNDYDSEDGPISSLESDGDVDPAFANFTASTDNIDDQAAPVAENLPISPDDAGLIEVQTTPQEVLGNTWDVGDPIRRISGIPSANRGVVNVNLQDSLSVATTKMALNNYSQLAIMQSDRHVRGIISWESVAKRSLRSPNAQVVSDCKIDAQVIEADASLFEALPTIEKHGYVLVRSRGAITGIVTASDVAVELRSLSYAFTSIGTIEGLIRRKLSSVLTAADLECLEAHSRAKQHNDLNLTTFGESVRLLENIAIWKRLNLQVDRAEVVARLNRIRDIRNDVMHFSPDPLGAGQKRELEQMEEFLRHILA